MKRLLPFRIPVFPPMVVSLPFSQRIVQIERLFTTPESATHQKETPAGGRGSKAAK
jgi:hypothetical protein